MKFETSFFVAATLLASTQAAAVEKRQWAGKCTIGIENHTGQIPGGNAATGGGANTNVQSMYSYIVGSDNRQTNFDVKQHNNKDTSVYADGNYGGISGGNWHIESYNPHAGNIGSCTISFTGRSDKGDETFDSTNAPEGTCDTYHGADGFAAAKSGCRCRFDCQ